MKALLLLAIFATMEVSSCNDTTIVERLKAASDKTERECLSKGGVPGYEPVYDHGTATYSMRVSRCDFPFQLDFPFQPATR